MRDTLISIIIVICFALVLFGWGKLQDYFEKKDQRERERERKMRLPSQL